MLLLDVERLDLQFIYESAHLAKIGPPLGAFLGEAAAKADFAVELEPVG